MTSESLDRMPPLPGSEQSAAQRAAEAALVSGPRGALVGPFVPLLRCPELMTRVQLLGEHLRFGVALEKRLTELVILVVARAWDQQFEWGYHHPIALAQGLGAEVVDDVSRGQRPASGDAVVLAVWDLVDELQRTRQVADATYDAARHLLGEEGVVEVVATAGYYTTLAMTMNVARTPPPPGAPRLP